MVDLHSHILHGFDDGARNEDMSLSMVRTASKTGTRQMVATPHVMNEVGRPLWEDIVAGCRRLQKMVLDVNSNLAILPGAEVTLYPDVLELITGPGAYCVNEGRYLLVELPSSEIPLYADHFLFTLQLRGITPIVVHPERHPELRSDHSILERWIGRGILVQLNGPSLTGQMGRKVKTAAEILLKKNMVHCIGSDAHNDLSRSSDLSAVRKRIKELVGWQRAEQILTENPNCIITNQDIRKLSSDSIEGHGKKSLFSWWSLGI